MADRPRQRLAAIAAASAFALLGPACSGGEPVVAPPSRSGQPTGRVDPPDGNGSDCAFDGTRSREFEGTAVVDLSYRDALGESYERSHTRTDAGLELGPPAQDGALRETNPLHLAFGTVDQLAQGSFAGISAVPFVDPEDGDRAILGYWTLTASCDRLAGTLSNSHKSEGFDIANTVMAQRHIGPGLGFMDWSFRMDDGTTLEARVDGDRVELTITGRDVEGRLGFTIRVTATLA